jgi:hypothetical protein
MAACSTAGITVVERNPSVDSLVDLHFGAGDAETPCLLRQSNIRTAMNIYTQAAPDAIRDANSRVVEMEMVLAKRKVG